MSSFTTGDVQRVVVPYDKSIIVCPAGEVASTVTLLFSGDWYAVFSILAKYFTMSFNGFIKCIHKGRLTNWFFHEGSQTYILGVGGFLKRRLKHLCFIGFSKFVLQLRMGCFDETLNCFTLLLKLNANDMQQSNRKLNIAPSEQIIFFIWPARI